MAKVHVEKGSLGRVSFYNATEVAKEHRGWPLGVFVTDEEGEPLTKEFEVRLTHQKVGDRRDEWAAPVPGVTFYMVLSGAQRQIFAPNGIDKAPIDRVVRAGEAVFFDNSIPHKWITEEDGMQVGIRRLQD